MLQSDQEQVCKLTQSERGMKCSATPRDTHTGSEEEMNKGNVREGEEIGTRFQDHETDSKC